MRVGPPFASPLKWHVSQALFAVPRDAESGISWQWKQPRMRGSWSRVASSSCSTGPWHWAQPMFRSTCDL